MSEISDLFARDPLQLTNQDLTKIITHFRASRAAFMSTGARAKADAGPKEPKAKKEKMTGLSLDDLDI